MKKKKQINLFKILNIVSAVSMLITLIVGILLVLKVLPFVSVLPQVIYSVIIVIVCIVLLVLTISGLSLIYQKNHVVRGVAYVLSILLIVGGMYGTSVLGRVGNSIGKIINTGNTLQSTKAAVFVTYDNDQILSIDDIENCRFGIIDSEYSNEGRLMPMAELEDKKITVQYVEFETYKDMLDALYLGDIDVAALPSSFRSLISYSEPTEEDEYESSEEDENENSGEISLTSPEELESLLDLMNVIYEYDHKVEESIVQTNKDINVSTEPFSVLLLGTADGLSDTMILATFNPVNFTVTMTSIARDSYVPIACYSGGRKDKINAARAIGGIQCAIDTVENLTGVDIDFYVETNFQGIVDIVDAMGGLILNVPFEFVGQDASSTRGNYTVWVPAGENNLNGLQVLAFARERYKFADGDFSRQSNQQTVIRAIAEKLLNTKDINTILNVLDAAGDNVTTNIPMDKIVSLLTYSIDVIGNSYEKNSNILDMKTSRITGIGDTLYTSYADLWIYKLYNSSINENVELINRNLQVITTLKKKVNFEFDVMYPYVRDPLYTVSFAEVIEREKPREVLANYVGKDIKILEEWCKEKNIELNIINVYEGDEGWSEEIADGIILTQSVKAGTDVEEITSITVSVNKNEKITDFTGKTIDELQEWALENNIIVDLKTNVIDQNNEKWSFEKAGLIQKQTYNAKEKTIIPTYYDYLTLDVTKIVNTVDQETFAKQLSGYGFTNVQFVETAVESTQKPGTIVSISMGGVIQKGSFILKNNTDAAYQLIVTYVAEGYTVKFEDAAGEKSITAKLNDTITLPTAAQKEGYVFAGWNYNNSTYSEGASFTVTGSVKFTAVYTDQSQAPTEFTVTFYDIDGTVLNSQKVQSGGTAAAPSAPEGYVYVWDSELTNITSNRDIKLVKIQCANGYTSDGNGGCVVAVTESYTVTFYDASQKAISTQTVVKGSAAIAPEAPAKEKYKFTGWDRDFSNVQSNLDVYPTYNECSDSNGDISNGCEVSPSCSEGQEPDGNGGCKDISQAEETSTEQTTQSDPNSEDSPSLSSEG